MINRIFYIAILLLAGYVNGFCQITGQILSNKTNKPVAYASILVLDSIQSGTIADTLGHFSVTARPNASLRVSAVGFNDTLIKVNNINQAFTIHLKEKIFMLPEVVVSSQNEPPIIIGKPEANLLGPMTNSTRGSYSGIYLKPKKKEIGKQVDSIRIYIPESGACNTLLGMRLLASEIPIKKNQDYAADELYELLPSLFTFTAPQTGWFTIDLSDKNIYMPKQAFFVLFTILDNDVDIDKVPILGINLTLSSRYCYTFYDPESNTYLTVKKSFLKIFTPMIVIYLS